VTNSQARSPSLNSLVIVTESLDHRVPCDQLSGLQRSLIIDQLGAGEFPDTTLSFVVGQGDVDGE
jgi:hypothetical protein